MQLTDLFLKIDSFILSLSSFGPLAYVVLFLIIFIETGIVVFPFLPGDSLIFTTGVLSARNLFYMPLLFLVFASAAILGDTLNYFVGKFFGQSMINSGRIKRHTLERTNKFFKKYGGKTIVLARFIPLVRTVAPFVAGFGRMQYRKFITYNILGGLGWVALFLFSGFYFGNIKFVQNNLSFVVIAIIIVSLIPVIVEIIKNRKNI